MAKPTYSVQDVLDIRRGIGGCRIEEAVLGRWSDVLLCLLLGGKLEVLHMEAGNFAVVTLPDVDATYSTYWDNSVDPTEAELWEELCPALSTGRQWTGYLLDQMHQRYQSAEVEWYVAEGGTPHVSIFTQALHMGIPNGKPCESVSRYLLTVLQTPTGVG
jgi:hypothetical protein